MSDPILFQKAPIVQLVERGTYWWCAFGRSKSQPFAMARTAVFLESGVEQASRLLKRASRQLPSKEFILDKGKAKRLAHSSQFR